MARTKKAGSVNERLAGARKALLTWFEAAHRDLPWRRTGDPYAVWVAEIMLQQTQVRTVAPYFERFMGRFPTVEVLAAADVDSVLKAWEGLGYYSRARNLHVSAQQIVREYGGRLPETREALLGLKGIGEYTAGAILSIAFERCEPVLDGNVARVLCRMMPIRQNPKLPRTRKRLWAIAHRLVQGRAPGDLNQAMMELGATVCTPRKPRCEGCPVRGFCRAYARGEQEKLPVRTEGKPVPHQAAAVAIVLKKGKLLIARRKSQGLLGGLWELPGGKHEPGETYAETAVRETKEELGITVAVERALPAVRHAYSHFTVTLHPFVCRHVSGRGQALGCDAFKWIGLGEIEEYAFPAANHKIFAHLLRANR